jgi:DnaK suppressor protein
MAPPDHVTRGHLDRLQRALDERERALHELIAGQRDAIEQFLPEGEAPGDEADQAQNRERRTIGSDLLDLYLAEMGEIAAARERVAAGTYGSCADCGEPIGAGRLEAQPTARRCVGCQALHERLFAPAH